MTEDSNSHQYQEILARLAAIQRDKRPDIPLIDPTANVLALVTAETKRQDDLRMAEFKRQDDLRVQAERFNDKLQAERQRADSEARRAEAGRIDSLLSANTNNVALALAKQESLALTFEKRIAVLEQNQYQGLGASGQRTEGRQQNQWIIGIVIVVAIFLANFLSGILGAHRP
jgi:hypothetical protein